MLAVDHRIKLGAVIGSIVAAVLVVILVGKNQLQPHFALANDTDLPELRALENRAVQSGVLQSYEILF